MITILLSRLFRHSTNIITQPSSTILCIRVGALDSSLSFGSNTYMCIVYIILFFVISQIVKYSYGASLQLESQKISLNPPKEATLNGGCRKDSHLLVHCTRPSSTWQRYISIKIWMVIRPQLQIQWGDMGLYILFDQFLKEELIRSFL